MEMVRLSSEFNCYCYITSFKLLSVCIASDYVQIFWMVCNKKITHIMHFRFHNTKRIILPTMVTGLDALFFDALNWEQVFFVIMYVMEKPTGHWLHWRSVQPTPIFVAFKSLTTWLTVLATFNTWAPSCLLPMPYMAARWCNVTVVIYVQYDVRTNYETY